MKRRTVLAVLGLGALGVAGWRYWPEDGFTNPCPREPMPESLARHPLVQEAWRGIDPAQFWDCHVHLAGGGRDDDSWINPQLRAWRHPLQYAQLKFYLNAACVADDERADFDYVDRLRALHGDFPPGARFMLLAFDYHYNERGERVPELSSIHIADRRAADVAREFPQVFQWIASVHPYRADCVAALEWAAANGARAVKWLPNAMGIDPASPRCDRFYQAMARLKLPLLTHGGDERAVHGGGMDTHGNPLRLRRALDAGVRVIVAHCAALGESPDLDRGADGAPVANIDLFGRLMDDPRYRGKLFGDLSAITQINYPLAAIKTLLTRADWHDRLLYGSDYPLPGVMPLISTRRLARAGLLDAADVPVLSAIRRHNPLLFDFLLKRRLRWEGRFMSPIAFEARRLFDAG